MFGNNAPSLVTVAVLAVLALIFLARGRRGIDQGGPTLVLRKFEIDETPSANVLVDIAGRASGIMGWLMTVVGLNPETRLKVTNQEVSFTSSSLFGQVHQAVPLIRVSSTHCGYSKPVGYLIAGAVVLVGGILLGGRAILAGFVAAGACAAAYYLSKKVVISLESTGGMVLGLSFSPSVLENVPVDIERARKAIEILNQRIMESQQPSEHKGR